MPLRLKYSPCPNDTFIFHALAHGLPGIAESGLSFDIGLDDVETLNADLARGTGPDVSKLSVAACAGILDDYVILHAGGAMGYGCGPILVAREAVTPDDLRIETVAVPGRMTTANLLLELHGGFDGPRPALLYNEVAPAVLDGRAAAGVIIHEGRFTYGELGLHKVLDLGEWWESAYDAPLPLGVIVARRALGMETIRTIEAAIRASAAHALAHPAHSRTYVKQHAQEMADSVIDAHIATFVNDFSVDMGPEGEAAVAHLVGAARGVLGLPAPDPAALFPAGPGC